MNPATLATRLGFFLSLFVLWGCRSGPPPAKYGVFAMALDEQTLIRDADLQMFRRASDVALDSRGIIYVLDEGLGQVAAFTPNGELSGMIGRKGQGPGEFSNPRKLFIDSVDRIYLCDQGTSILAFDPSGVYDRSFKLDFMMPPFPFEARFFYIDESRNVYALSWDFTPAGLVQNLIKANADGKIVATVARYPEESVKVSGGPATGGGVVGGVLHPYSAAALFYARADLLYHGSNLEYKIFVSDLDGRAVRTIEGWEPAVEISPSEKAYLGDGKPGVKIPSHRPFFKSLIADDRGRLFVTRVKPLLDKQPGETIDIFGPDGAYLYRTNLPLVPKAIRGNAVYSLDLDEEKRFVLKKFTIKNYADLKDR